MTAIREPGKVGATLMRPPALSPGGRFSAAALLLLVAGLACGDDLILEFPRPSEPFELTLHDLLKGPIDRPSAFDVVAGYGVGRPRAVRVDQTDGWDVAFAVLDGQAVWLPRGFFDALEDSSGVLELQREFSEVPRAPADRELYETRDPVPLSVGNTYVVLSRNNPAISFPCRIYAKLGVESVEGDPQRLRIRYLWNPNCDDRNLTPGEGS